MLTRQRRANGDWGLGAEDCVLECKIDHDFEIDTARWTRGSATTTEPATAVEEHVEQISEPTAERARPRSNTIRSEGVVPSPLLRILQRLVGDTDLLESRLGGMVAGVGVGMQLARQTAIGAFDLFRARVARDAEKVVVVLSHDYPSLRCLPSRLLTTATAARACG